MAQIREFLSAIDPKWKLIGGEPIRLQIIGSAALMLQCDYERGTKDGDVLESREISSAVKEQLLAIAGKESEIFKRFRMHIDIVNSAILFLPQKPVFHRIKDLRLKNFSIEVLDVVDVAVSKLKRFNSSDQDDIRAMAGKKLLDHKRLIARFEAAADWFSMDARASDVPRYLKNLHKVERDILGLPPSKIELPPECRPD